MAKTQELPLRKDVPEKLTWDLTTVYSSDADFEKDFTEVKADSKKFAGLSGTIEKDAESLLKATEDLLKLSRTLEKCMFILS